MKQVGGAIKKVFPRASVISIKRFKKGCVNKTYDVKIKNPNKNLVVRIYPKDGWKAVKEANIYNLVSQKTNIPVPDVYAIGKRFLILSKIKGRSLKKEKKLIQEAGEYLAKLHKIKFKKSGWIIDKGIKPSFNRWIDFCEYDLKHKLTNLKRHKKLSKELITKIKDYFDKNKYLLNINIKSCLIHKDYHESHIIADKKINGIIDFEWAISGHNELDLTKSLAWMFEKNKKLEKVFLKGYKKYNKISKDFPQRRKLYEVLIAVSSLLFSCELKNDKWFNYNIKMLRGLLK